MLKPLPLSLVLVCLMVANSQANNLAKVIKLASVEKAQMLLSTEDDFFQALSPFDIQALIGDPKGTKEELIAFMPTLAREFSASEAEELTKGAQQIDQLTQERRK